MQPIVIIVLALAGLSLAAFIHVKKKLAAPLVCPIGHSCDPVVHSDYSRFMNIPVEILGILYYTLILLAYSLFVLYPEMQSQELVVSLLMSSSIAFLFSLYLTFVQAFILKEWCTWCLISAALCTGIFAMGLSLYSLAL